MTKKILFYNTSNFHNAYYHMCLNIPEGFECNKLECMGNPFLNRSNFNSAFLSNYTKKFNIYLQSNLSQLYNKLHITLNRPKVRNFFSSEYDLIHSCQSLLNTNLPYIVDFEHPAVFSGYNQYGLDNPRFIRELTKLFLNKKLKKLLSWSLASKQHLISLIDNKDLESKIEVIYPIFTPPDTLNKSKHDSVNFLFVGKIFFEKGGFDTLLAFDKISEKYDTQLIMVAPVPEYIKTRFSKNRKILFLGPQPYEKVKQLYLESDVFVFPTHFDTYGFVVPESFSYGLPVISVDSFSMPELVTHMKTGLIVKSFYTCFRSDGGYIYPTAEQLGSKRLEATKHPTEKYINELSQSMKLLIENDSLRAKLSINARKEATEGKFSPLRWKKQMKRIYVEACE